MTLRTGTDDSDVAAAVWALELFRECIVLSSLAPFPWGLSPVKNEIPLVTVTEEQSCSWQGLWSLLFANILEEEEASRPCSGDLPSERASFISCLVRGEEGVGSPHFVDHCSVALLSLPQGQLLDKTLRPGSRGLVGIFPK